MKSLSFKLYETMPTGFKTFGGQPNVLCVFLNKPQYFTTIKSQKPINKINQFCIFHNQNTNTRNMRKKIDFKKGVHNILQW